MNTNSLRKYLVTASAVFVTLISTSVADPCNAPLPQPGTTFSGEVTHIIDGDGLCVGRDQGGIEVRLADFNACELNDAGGQAAREILRKITFGKIVECVAGKRSYDRIVAACTVEGQPIGKVMRYAQACEGGRGSNNRAN